MQFKNTDNRYGLIAISLHWFVAVLVVALLTIGLYMTSLPDGDPKWEWYSLHKSLGISVFVLAVVRLIWRQLNIQPKLPSGLKRYEIKLAHLTHAILYLALLVLPLSGYVDSSAGGYHLAWFGIDIPLLIPENKILLEISETLHSSFAYLLIGLLAMHLAAVAKHHFILKDDTLKRMLPLKGDAASGKQSENQ
ncbi:MAG: cytochrome b [Candidatus Thiodiazotropha sp.]